MRCAIILLLLAKDVKATVSRDQVIELASEWAADFYQDESRGRGR